MTRTADRCNADQVFSRDGAVLAYELTACGHTLPKRSARCTHGTRLWIDSPQGSTRQRSGGSVRQYANHPRRRGVPRRANAAPRYTALGTRGLDAVPPTLLHRHARLFPSSSFPLACTAAWPVRAKPGAALDLSTAPAPRQNAGPIPRRFKVPAVRRGAPCYSTAPNGGSNAGTARGIAAHAPQPAAAAQWRARTGRLPAFSGGRAGRRRAGRQQRR